MQDFLMGLKFFWDKGKKLFIALVVFGILLAILIIGLIVWIFGSLSQSGGGASLSPSYMVRESSDMAYQGSFVGSDSVSGYRKVISPLPNAPASTPSVPADKKVIKNGALSLLVKNAEDSLSKINKIASENEGFIENSEIYEVEEGIKSGSAMIRVPSNNFVKAMSALKEIAVKVQSENTNSRDVTAEYVDLEAQIKNLKAEEKQYQDIMNRAGKIQDVLDVASRLADVRGRIERTQGQLNYLARQVDMSTISISLTAEPEVRVFGIIWRPLTVLKQSFKGLLSDLAGFVDGLVKFLFKVPIYLLKIVVALFVIWVCWRAILWGKRKFWR